MFGTAAGGVGPRRAAAAIASGVSMSAAFQRNWPSRVAAGLATIVWPGVPAETTAKLRPAAARRSPIVSRWSGDSRPAESVRKSAGSCVRSRRSGARVASKTVLPTMPCAPGRQPVTSDGVATRVSLGKTLRASANRVPRAMSAERAGISSSLTRSGLSPSRTIMTKRILLVPRHVGEDAGSAPIRHAAKL